MIRFQSFSFDLSVDVYIRINNTLRHIQIIFQEKKIIMMFFNVLSNGVFLIFDRSDDSTLDNRHKGNQFTARVIVAVLLLLTTCIVGRQ